MKENLKKTYQFIIKYRYWLTIGFFVFWMLFFDQNSVIKIIKNQKELNSLKKQEIFLKEKIKKDSVKLYELKTNDKTLEKFAREQYYFHKPDEDVFVIKKVE